ncbi:hypothetical protein BKA69DRAFT_1092042 [Paraphysoderma sedebokerense]|nr:hypothetical protein BKA69DRAFT_1092042 [Paraphysoderma sedebokerense]
MSDHLSTDKTIEESSPDDISKNPPPPSYSSSPSPSISDRTESQENINTPSHYIEVPHENVDSTAPPTYDNTTSFENQTFGVKIASVFCLPFYVVFVDFIPWVYHSTIKLISVLWHAILTAEKYIASAISHFFVLPISIAISWTVSAILLICSKIWAGVVAAYNAIYIWILCPIGRTLAEILTFVVDYIVKPVIAGIEAVFSGFNRYIIQPIWAGICAIGSAILKGFKFVYNRILVPIWKFICLCAISTYHFSIDYIFIPTLKFFALLFKYLFLIPATYFVKGVKWLGSTVGSGLLWIWHQLLVAYILRPIWGAIKYISNGLYVFAMNVFMACKSLSSAIGNFIWKWFLNPIWKGITWVGRSIKNWFILPIWNILVSVKRWIASSIVLPLMSSVLGMLKGIGRLLKSMKNSITATLSQVRKNVRSIFRQSS